MDEIVRCKTCGCSMHYVENRRWNEFYVIKIDTWVCGRCNRISEEPRLDKKYSYK